MKASIQLWSQEMHNQALQRMPYTPQVTTELGVMWRKK
jgi:hypothetical protein